MTCSVCNWRGPQTPFFPQFDHKNRCFHCQPEKKSRKAKKEAEYISKNVDFQKEESLD